MHENQILQLRTERGWSQQQLIRQLIEAASRRNVALPDSPTLRVTLSGWENGRHRPTPMYRELLALALEVSEAELGWGDRATPAPLRVGPELVDYLTSMFELHARADQDLGSQLLVDVVTEQTKRAEDWALNARGADRSSLLWIVGRYAEFCGWLHQDQGDFTQADQWTARAIEISQALGDLRLVAYGMTRRSNIATEGGHAVAGLHLAEAALQQPVELNPGVVALAQRQLAVSNAMLGNHRACLKAVRLGAESVSGSSDPSPESDYCTAAYIAMEGGHALSISGRLRESVLLFDRALTEWPAGQQRDQGLCLARLAGVYAGAGEVEAACEIGVRAVSALKAAPSARTATALRQLRGRLNLHRLRRDVTDLREVLAEAV